MHTHAHMQTQHGHVNTGAGTHNHKHTGAVTHTHTTVGGHLAVRRRRRYLTPVNTVSSHRSARRARAKAAADTHDSASSNTHLHTHTHKERLTERE